MMITNYCIFCTAITALSSMASLGWGIAAYTKAMRNTLPAKHKMTVSGLVLQTFWRMGMIAARVAALALVATVLNEWLLVIMGLYFCILLFVCVCYRTCHYWSTIICIIESAKYMNCKRWLLLFYK